MSAVATSCAQQRSLSVKNQGTKFQNTCLVDSLRSLGFDLNYTRHGPMWAVADGNRLLQPYKPLVLEGIHTTFITSVSALKFSASIPAIVKASYRSAPSTKLCLRKLFALREEPLHGSTGLGRWHRAGTNQSPKARVQDDATGRV